MSKTIYIFLSAILLSFTACEQNGGIIQPIPAGTYSNGGIVQPIPPGTYSYTSYDSNGTSIANGWLLITISDSCQITGEWKINKIGNPENIGPQIGEGELIGSFTNKETWIELNPQFADNNVQLKGKLENNQYSGIWLWSTFIGVTNHGTFEAIKQTD